MAVKKDYAPTKQTTVGLFDVAKLHSVTMGVTIPLATPYSNIKLEVICDDAETCRNALIEILGMTLPFQSDVDRELVARYVRNILIKT
jgi:hypothetical protein